MAESQDVSKSISFKNILVSAKPTINLIKFSSFGLGIILIGWLVSQVEWAAALEILQDIPLSFLILGLLLYTLSFYLRSVRFRLLLPSEQKLTLLFPIVLIHYTALNIIPARLGELSYVYLLKKLHQISPGRSVSTLLLVRVFDQISISILFLFSLGVVDVTTSWLRTLSWVVGAGLIASVVLMLLLLTYKKLCLHWFKKLLYFLKWERYKLTQRLIQLMEEIVTGFDELQSKKTAGLVFSLSLLIWISILGVNYVVLKAFQVHLSYIEVMLASTFLILLTVLPFQVFSGLGLRSITWTVVAGAMGVAKDTAIVSAFGSRVVVTLYLVVVGAYGFWKISTVLSQEGNKP